MSACVSFYQAGPVDTELTDQLQNIIVTQTPSFKTNL